MMKIKKEKKPFKREYIPIILAVLILFVLIAALIYLIGHDFKFDEEKVNENQHQQEEILIDNSNSKCSKEELNELYKLAENVKVETEMKEVEDPDNPVYDMDEEKWVTGYSIVPIIKFTNLKSKLYAYISNDFNGKTQELKLESDKGEVNGVQSDEIVEYIIEIKANDYGCKGETIRKFTVKTPIYNSFSEMESCVDYPDYEYCKEYITEDLPSMQEFKLGLQKYVKTLKSTAAPKFTFSTTSTNAEQTTSTTAIANKKKIKRIIKQLFI